MMTAFRRLFARGYKYYYPFQTLVILLFIPKTTLCSFHICIRQGEKIPVLQEKTN